MASAGVVPADNAARPAVHASHAAAVQHRFDAAHRTVAAAAEDDGGSASADSHPDRVAPHAAAEASRPTDGDALLRLHAEDLVERLQAWASELDAREAQLNARMALHEHRERQFRLWSQARQSELEQALRDAERMGAHLEAQARRIALTDSAFD